GRVEMEEPVNVFTPGPYLLYGSGFEQFACFQRHLADLRKDVYRLRSREVVPAMNAGPVQHLKCAAETVLMDRRRSIEPEIYVYMKLGSCVQGYRRHGQH